MSTNARWQGNFPRIENWQKITRIILPSTYSYQRFLIQNIVLQCDLPHLMHRSLIAIPCPYANSIPPLVQPRCFSLTLKRHFGRYTWLNSYATHVYAACTITVRVHRVLCSKTKNNWIFPHKATNSLILGLPCAWKCFNSTLHFPFESYILSHCEVLEEEKFGE